MPVLRIVPALVLALSLAVVFPSWANEPAATDGRALAVADGAAGVVISEFLTLNGSKKPLGPGGLLDDDGDSSDWIELHNPTDGAIDLKGWYLTDDPNDLTRWRFPAGTTISSEKKVLSLSHL